MEYNLDYYKLIWNRLTYILHRRISAPYGLASATQGYAEIRSRFCDYVFHCKDARRQIPKRYIQIKAKTFERDLDR